MVDAVKDLFVAGGWVMWPLLALSVVSVALSLERTLFWWSMKRAGRGDRGGWVRRIAGMLAASRFSEARAVAGEDRTVYGRFVLSITPGAVETTEKEEPVKKAGSGADAGSDERSENRTTAPRTLPPASAPEAAIEEVRPAVERWSVTMSTIITAAPMLGILGTVLGIIDSFQLLGAREDVVVDPTEVAGGIAEALLTTAFGLIVALVTLFPYNIFRAGADRCFGRLETLVAAVESSKAANRRGDN